MGGGEEASGQDRDQICRVSLLQTDTYYDGHRKMMGKTHTATRRAKETRKAGEGYGDGDVSRWILLDMGDMGGQTRP